MPSLIKNFALIFFPTDQCDKEFVSVSESEKKLTYFSSNDLFFYKIEEILLTKSDIVCLLNDMWLTDNVNTFLLSKLKSFIT